MAERAYTRRTQSRGIPVTEIPPPRRKLGPDQASARASLLPLTLIDLEQHPDGELLRLCGRMTNLQDRFDQPGSGADQALSNEYWATADLITAIHPKTLDGFQMKAMVALGMLMPSARQVRGMCGGTLSVWAGAVSVVNDVIRGLPT